MTTSEFKERFPEYSYLEGDALWNKMEEILWEIGEVFYVDPNQKKAYHDPVEIDIIQDDGSILSSKIFIEDSSKTKWLDSKGKEVKNNIPTAENKITGNTSYSFVTVDLTNK